jgi:hypothetical protein
MCPHSATAPTPGWYLRYLRTVACGWAMSTMHSSHLCLSVTAGGLTARCAPSLRSVPSASASSSERDVSTFPRLWWCLSKGEMRPCEICRSHTQIKPPTGGEMGCGHATVSYPSLSSCHSCTISRQSYVSKQQRWSVGFQTLNASPCAPSPPGLATSVRCTSSNTPPCMYQTDFESASPPTVTNCAAPSAVLDQIRC